MVLAGITGNENRLTHGLISDTVNFAARIEDLTRHFECDILLSEESVSRLKGDYKLEPF